MQTITLPSITRHANGDGTFRYLIDTMPDFELKASKVLYTHASVLVDPGKPDPAVAIVNFHKAHPGARGASSRGWVRAGVATIEEC